MGVGCPWLRLTRTLPSAATLVAMSSTIGPPCPVGMQTEMGFVTMRPSAPAKGRDDGAGAVAVDHGDADHAARRRHGRVFAQASDVIAVVNPHRTHRLVLGPVDSHFHGSRPGRLAVAPIGVQHHRRRRFLNHVQGCIRHAVALLHVGQILRDADDPVGVVPHQVGRHQITADQARFRLPRSRRPGICASSLLQVRPPARLACLGPSFDVSPGNENRVG